jgi:electron transport complex protein RnfB
VTNKAFSVPSNPIRDAVREALPGANCGACGFPGCDGLADALATGKAEINACPVSDESQKKEISTILGIERGESLEKIVAKVICQGDNDRCKPKYVYEGISDCVAASLIADGNKACRYACLGLGTCVRSCQFDAISIDKHKGIAVIDAVKCKQCGKCLEVCPKHVLSMQPLSLPVRLLCRAAEEGKLVSDNCRVGCNGCEICANQCKFNAITMVNHLPVIHRDHCVGCMMCAEVCPTSAIQGDFDNRMIAQINRSICIGCGLCTKACQFEAIAGERKFPHTVSEACTGCGLCVAKCPKKCIMLSVRKHVRDENAKVGITPYEAAIPQKQTI